ncbi:hypothetical protein OG320_32060 [Microbispora sp. NBC_01189]|uniref:hypothetical protein n=1 Tax=Microbispora sp. NBC_01189 TaxID=2903583 RepID=UPI002E10BAB4|nr:hypothetical protein OG320_32060 [Microbispora sp. NBC_01189]
MRRSFPVAPFAAGRSVTRGFLVVLLSLSLLATACPGEEFGDSPNPTKTEKEHVQGPKKSNEAKGPVCPVPESRARSQLPRFPAADGVGLITQNPCLSFAGLVEEVLGFVPEGRSEKFNEFRGGLESLVARVNAVNDVAECAYETGHLAIGVYHHNRTPWSIGVVAVVRKDLDAVIGTGVCWLLRRAQLDAPTENQRFLSDEIRPDFCNDAVGREVNGVPFTILWVGSSNVMCGSLSSLYKGTPEPHPVVSESGGGDAGARGGEEQHVDPGGGDGGGEGSPGQTPAE